MDYEAVGWPFLHSSTFKFHVLFHFRIVFERKWLNKFYFERALDIVRNEIKIISRPD